MTSLFREHAVLDCMHIDISRSIFIDWISCSDPQQHLEGVEDLWINQIQEVPVLIHQAMSLPR